MNISRFTVHRPVFTTMVTLVVVLLGLVALLRLPVDLYTMVLGGEVTLHTLKGQRLALTIPPETQAGRVFRLRGQGMPRLRAPEERGDLLVEVTPVIAPAPTEREQELFRQLAELRR